MAAAGWSGDRSQLHHVDEHFKQRVGREDQRRRNGYERPLGAEIHTSMAPFASSKFSMMQRPKTAESASLAAVGMPEMELPPLLSADDATLGGHSSVPFPPRHDKGRRKFFGHKVTDVTTKQNCAYVKWFQSDSMDESPQRLTRRLNFLGDDDFRSFRLKNTLLGGGFSDFQSWTTSYAAAHSSPSSPSGTRERGERGGLNSGRTTPRSAR
mmetsp:Transcript_47144/g.83514  ORF Transcript_47144/g.83514 Transcript_47144/m.83514 type:complete len:211 (-) Transcript_47144:131-763(-)